MAIGFSPGRPIRHSRTPTRAPGSDGLPQRFGGRSPARAGFGPISSRWRASGSTTILRRPGGIPCWRSSGSHVSATVFQVDVRTRALFETLPRRAGEARGRCPGRMRTSSVFSRASKRGPCALSFAQEQLWFLDQLAPGSPVYQYRGRDPVGSYDADALRKALTELVRRHEILRTVFFRTRRPPRSDRAATIDLVLSEVDLGSLPRTSGSTNGPAWCARKGRKPFDLSRAPLFRGTMVHVHARAPLAIHHSSCRRREWSMELIHQEVDRCTKPLHAAALSPDGAADPVRGLRCWQREWGKEERAAEEALVLEGGARGGAVRTGARDGQAPSRPSKASVARRRSSRCPAARGAA